MYLRTQSELYLMRNYEHFLLQKKLTTHKMRLVGRVEITTISQFKKQ